MLVSDSVITVAFLVYWRRNVILIMLKKKKMTMSMNKEMCTNLMFCYNYGCYNTEFLIIITMCYILGKKKQNIAFTGER